MKAMILILAGFVLPATIATTAFGATQPAQIAVSR